MGIDNVGGNVPTSVTIYLGSRLVVGRGALNSAAVVRSHPPQNNFK